MSEENLFGDAPEEVSQDILKTLYELCDKFLTLKRSIEEKEEDLKKTVSEFENVSRNLIPSVLNSAGFSDIRLSNGMKVEVRDKLKASISNSDYTLAYRNMVNAEGGDEEATKIIDSLFKSEIKIEDISEKVLELLLENEIPYETKRSIHHQTLGKYCKTLLEEGRTIPEGINVFQYQETSIKL